MITALLIIVLLALAMVIFMSQAKFGKMPGRARLEKIKQSPNFRNGSFQNLSHTPTLAEGTSYYQVFKDFFFSDRKRVKPSDMIPSRKTDLRAIEPGADVLVWFGHSSYFMQLDGRRFLVDPVLSGSASPIAMTTRSFIGTDVYTPDDFPEIDYLFITHDHWDHLDHQTIVRLKPKIGKVVCGLGTGEHLEHWGYDPSVIIEKDWNEEISLEPGFSAYTVPARHFSGRGFSRNKSLWTSFVLQTPANRIFIGGDSGYDHHFAAIGKKFGGFDLAILENGQYNRNWRYIHMMPHEVLQAAKDLGAARVFPVHSGKFALSNHAWDAPLSTITELNKEAGLSVVTPMIGEVVNLKDKTQLFSEWWTRIR